MKHRRSSARKLGSPIVSLFTFGAAACGTGDGAVDSSNPFAIETYDETIETGRQALTAGSAAVIEDGGVAGSAGAGGTAGKTGQGGTPSMVDGGRAGSATGGASGRAGAGGSATGG